jgi:hypothetical protein
MLIFSYGTVPPYRYRFCGTSLKIFFQIFFMALGVVLTFNPSPMPERFLKFVRLEMSEALKFFADPNVAKSGARED